MQEDYCGCIKAPGGYGMGGWHFVIVDRAFIAEKIRSAEAMERAKPGTGYRRGGIFTSWREEAEFWRGSGERYLGTAVAWEPCPAFRAQVRDQQAKKPKSSAPSERDFD